MGKINSLLSAIVILSLPQPILSQTGQSTKQPLSGDVLERKVPGEDLKYLTTTEAFGQALLSTRTAGGRWRQFCWGM